MKQLNSKLIEQLREQLNVETQELQEINRAIKVLQGKKSYRTKKIKSLLNNIEILGAGQKKLF